MQSGTAGVNTVRIYSPIKQANNQGPAGEFVRRWVPELATEAYPKPVIDRMQTIALAEQRIYASRRSEKARLEVALVLEKHGSRKRPARHGNAKDIDFS